MNFDSKAEIDQVAWRLLRELQANARLSLAELGRRVGLTAPAVAERLRRLEAAGVISGYHASLNPALLGLPLLVFIRLSTTPQSYPQIAALLEGMPEVLECHHVTGADSFIIKARAATVEHIEILIRKLSTYGTTATSVVLSSPVLRNTLEWGPPR